MKKKILIISGIAVAVVIAVILCIVFFGGNERTLEEITLGKYGGGHLRYEVNKYKIVEIYFESTSKNGDEREGICHVQTNYYKEASYSPSGKIFDYCDEKEYECSFTDYSLTLGLADNYTYSVEVRNDKEYVVFSKPFFGMTSWYVSK